MLRSRSLAAAIPSGERASNAAATSLGALGACGLLAPTKSGREVAAGAGMVGGEIVGLDFLVELKSLRGREKLVDYPVRSTIIYP